MAEKENRQEGGNTPSGRDGYKSYNREGAGKYNRSEGGSAYGHRPRFNPNTEGRPQRRIVRAMRVGSRMKMAVTVRNVSSYTPRYNRDDNGRSSAHTVRVIMVGQQGEGGYRPQRSFYSPRYNKDNNDGEQRPYRPRYNGGQQAG